MVAKDKEMLSIIESYSRAELMQRTEVDSKIMKRWNYAHELMVDDFIIGKDLEDKIIEKFGVSRNTAKLDIKNANDYFINETEILRNIDFWRMLVFKWQLKALALAYKTNAIKEFNAGIKNIYLILGLDKASDGPDPEKFKDQINNFFSINIEDFNIKQEIDETAVLEFINQIDGLNTADKLNILKDAGFPNTRQKALLNKPASKDSAD